MAKTKSHEIIKYRTPKAPQPIVIRPRAAPAKKKHHGGRRHAQSSQKVLIGLVVGGFGLGFIDKSATAIPTIPVLGKAGTIAVAAHFLGKGRPGLVTDLRNAAAAIAAYEYGLSGKVSGDGVEGEL